MDTTRTLIIERDKQRVTVKLSRPYDIHELADLLYRRVGIRPFLSISGGIARASY